ncbi:MAG: hypothetical protein V4559_16195 [Pseudomonadota bacterium]
MDWLKFAPPYSVPNLRFKVSGGMPRSAIAVVHPKRAFDDIGPMSVGLAVALRHRAMSALLRRLSHRDIDHDDSFVMKADIWRQL